MYNAKINVNTDAETKQAAENLFAAMGLNMTTAINIFLKRALLEQGIPFDVSIKEPNSVTIEAIEEGRRIAKDNSVPSFKSVEELRAAMGL